MSHLTSRIATLTLRCLLAMSLTFWAGAQEHPASVSPTTTPSSQPIAPDGLPLLDRPALVVHEFTVSEKTGWPYDLKQLQSETVAELRGREKTLDVLVGPPATARAHAYTLEGEIVSWRAGNAAKRIMVGMGSGRESADIHYWLTDETGRRVLDHKDTIRAEFWGNAYAGSVGQLSHPFASKIAARLSQTKLF